MRLGSFDVFDTLLTRSFAVPRDLFLLLGKELKTHGFIQESPDYFARSRGEAERKARLLTSHGEVNLDEIYEQLAITFSWTTEITTRAVASELDLEERSICPVPGMLKQVQDLRAKTDRILFLTDMYLPPEFIEKLLRRHEFFRTGDMLYVSGQHRCSKASGKLFQKVKSDFAEITNWIHIGDHPHSDVKIPQQFGIETIEVDRVRLSRYENLARGSDSAVTLWRTRLAGAMRLARLENPETDTHRRVIWDTGCDVVGPLLFGFVHWCLEEATARGLKRLYFVSRDGQILHRIAQIIVAAWDYKIECRYLYGSRQAWHPAAIQKLSEADLTWILTPTRSLTPRQALARIGLEPESFSDTLKNVGLERADWDCKMSIGQCQKLGEILVIQPFKEAIEKTAAIKRETALGYLRQEGLFDGPGLAIVDIGWHGNLQSSLSRLLSLSDRPESARIFGLYFGLIAEPKGTIGQSLGGYWNAFAKREDPLRSQNLALFEIFTAADHGSVMGYQRQASRIEPWFAEMRNTRALNWGLTTLHASVLRFAEIFVENSRKNFFKPVEFFFVCRDGLKEFYSRPSAATATAWGSFQFSDGQIEGEYQQLVPDWNYRQIMTAVIHREKRPVYWWHQGTLATCTCLPLSLLLALKRLKQQLGSLI